jgi:membrane protein
MAKMSTVECARGAVSGRRGAWLKHTARDVGSGFQEQRVLVEAGAIAFRSLLALITAALCLLGLFGLLNLESVWTEEVVPQLRESASPPAFNLLDDAVLYVLTEEQLFWATAGFALALWQASSVIRAAGELLNRIYGVEETRSWKRVMLTSISVGAALLVVSAAALAAITAGRVGLEQLLGGGTVAAVLGAAVSWAVAIALLLLALGLVVRGASNAERPFRWITVGSAAIVGGLFLLTLVFGLYLTVIADFSSVFGNVATVFLLIEYLFLASVLFLVGLLLDAALERRSRASDRDRSSRLASRDDQVGVLALQGSESNTAG